MLSKEEIEESKRNAKRVLEADPLMATIDFQYIDISNLLEYIEQLESDKQKLIEKLEEEKNSINIEIKENRELINKRQEDLTIGEHTAMINNLIDKNKKLEIQLQHIKELLKILRGKANE